MTHQIQLGDILVDVAIKNIKHIRLSVHPPHGQVRISAPRHIPFDPLRLFSASKVDWIRKQQVKLRNQVRDASREFLNTESRLVWGKMVPLKIIEAVGKPRVEQTQTELFLYVRPESSCSTKGAIFDSWYRDQLRQAILSLLVKRTLLFHQVAVISSTPEEIIRSKRLGEVYDVPFVHMEQNGHHWGEPEGPQ